MLRMHFASVQLVGICMRMPRVNRSVREGTKTPIKFHRQKSCHCHHGVCLIEASLLLSWDSFADSMTTTEFQKLLYSHNEAKHFTRWTLSKWRPKKGPIIPDQTSTFFFLCTCIPLLLVSFSRWARMNGDGPIRPVIFLESSTSPQTASALRASRLTLFAHLVNFEMPQRCFEI